LRLVCASLLVTVASELAFTLYVSTYGLANFVGHCLKIVASLLLYKALVQVALTPPFRGPVSGAQAHGDEGARVPASTWTP
jgi:hypothetical protein